MPKYTEVTLLPLLASLPDVTDKGCEWEVADLGRGKGEARVSIGCAPRIKLVDVPTFIANVPNGAALIATYCNGQSMSAAQDVVLREAVEKLEAADVLAHKAWQRVIGARTATVVKVLILPDGVTCQPIDELSYQGHVRDSLVRMGQTPEVAAQIAATFRLPPDYFN